MPCVISDRVVSRDGVGAAVPQVGLRVSAAPTYTPLFVEIDEMRLIYDPSVAAETGPDGAWSITLPWPSESDPTTVRFTITLPNGTALVGVVPEGQAGPLTLHDLKQSHGWQLVKTTLQTPIAIQGPSGDDGDPGPVGITWRGDYDGATAYAVRDAVAYDGASYYCTVAATGVLPTDVGHWALIAAQGGAGDKGDKGDDGDPGPIGMTWRGAYSGATAYAVRDAVSYQGSSYYCTVAATGVLPTDAGHWALIADKGTDGTDGTDGVGVPTPIPSYNARIAAKAGATVWQQVEQAVATFDGSSAEAAVTWPTFASRPFRVHVLAPVTDSTDAIVVQTVAASVGATGCTVQASAPFTGTVPLWIEEVL